MAARSTPTNFRHSDWVALGVKVLRLEGPAALTVDHLCKRARRTKGSFYHHFRGIGELTLALARHWAEAESEAVAGTAHAGTTPKARLEAMLKLTPDADHRLERGVRSLAIQDAGVADLVRKSDDRRELVMTTLLAGAYGIGGAEAHHFARLFHALHLAALMRADEEVAAYADGPARALGALLESNFPTG